MTTQYLITFTTATHSRPGEDNCPWNTGFFWWIIFAVLSGQEPKTYIIKICIVFQIRYITHAKSSNTQTSRYWIVTQCVLSIRIVWKMSTYGMTRRHHTCWMNSSLISMIINCFQLKLVIVSTPLQRCIDFMVYGSPLIWVSSPLDHMPLTDRVHIRGSTILSNWHPYLEHCTQMILEHNKI